MLAFCSRCQRRIGVREPKPVIEGAFVCADCLYAQEVKGAQTTSPQAT